MMGNNRRVGGVGSRRAGDEERHRGEADPKSREGAVLLLGARRTALRTDSFGTQKRKSTQAGVTQLVRNSQ